MNVTAIVIVMLSLTFQLVNFLQVFSMIVVTCEGLKHDQSLSGHISSLCIQRQWIARSRLGWWRPNYNGRNSGCIPNRLAWFAHTLQLVVKHWLRTLVRNCLLGTAPSYPRYLGISVTSISGRGTLRSAGLCILFDPRISLSTTQHRRFSIVDPISWNSLPVKN